MRTNLSNKASRYLLLPGILLLTSWVQAQQIANNSFENWSVTSFYETPAAYFTTNFQSYFELGFANVTKSTDAHSGSFAAKLETVGSTGNTINGGIFLGQPGPGGIGGGIPYTQRPDSFKFYTKYNFIAGDTGTIFVMFRKLGNPLGYAQINLSGSQSVYTKVVVPVSWFIPLVLPDSVGMIAISSTTSMDPGSVLYLDDLQLTGATQQLPNPGFENWMDLSADSPDGWMNSNPYTIMGSGVSVSKSTDHVDGLFSVKITNCIGPQGDTTSYITNGGLGGNGPEGGTPITENPAKLTFYYKYQPVGSDSGLVFTMLSRWDSPSGTRIALDSSMKRLSTHPAWTYYEIPFNYAGFPHADTVTVAFAGGMVDEPGSGVQLGSTLWVDNVVLEYGPIGMQESLSPTFGIFPNPVIQQINIQGESSSAVLLEILSTDGKLLRSFNIIPGEKSDLSSLAKGCYLYRITKGTSVLTGKFVKM